MRTITFTVKRPSGDIETVDMSDKFGGMNDILFARIKDATAAAGKGDCLSYKVEDSVSPETLAEIKEHDKKAQWFAKHGFNPNQIN